MNQQGRVSQMSQGSVNQTGSGICFGRVSQEIRHS